MHESRCAKQVVSFVHTSHSEEHPTLLEHKQRTLHAVHTRNQECDRRFLADPRFQKALEVGLGISMSTGDAFASGGRGRAGAAGAAAAAQPMEEDGDVEDDDDDDDGPPPLEARPAALRSPPACDRAMRRASY
jgi:hypothetical protein